jgi:MoxR-like ATPase
MAAATKAKLTAVKPEAGLLPRFKSIFGKGGLLDQHNVERTEEINLLALAVLGGCDLLFLGDPGVGKSYLLEMFTEHGMTNATMFDHMIFKEAGADELIGIRSVKALQEDKIRRIVEGTLCEADTALLDEIFKGSASVLNALLDLFAKRVIKVGGKPIDCKQLITILMASNELPDREDLMPFRNRIDMTTIVRPVQTPDGRKKVRQIQLGQMQNGVTFAGEPLTLEEIHTARAEVEAIDLPEPVGEMLDDAQQKCMESGWIVSQRRMKNVYKVVKANAWLAGRKECAADDLLPVQHMLWDLLDHRDAARSIILEYASKFTRKAERLRQSLEPVLKSMDDLKAKINEEGGTPSQDTIEEGMKLLGTLRGVGREAKAQIAEGDKQGQDTSIQKDLLSEIEQANEWAEHALIGEL